MADQYSAFLNFVFGLNTYEAVYAYLPYSVLYVHTREHARTVRKLSCCAAVILYITHIAMLLKYIENVFEA